MNPRLATLLVAAFAFRLLFITSHGFKYDLDAYANWATLLATKGPLAIYGTLPQPAVDYPPGYLYVLWLAGIAHGVFGGGTRGMHVVLKIVPILADLVVIWFAYRAASRLANERAALVLAGVVAFSPPLWMDSAQWGQSDSVPIALLYATIFALLEGSIVTGLSLFTLAIVTKPQGIAIAPAVLVLGARSRDLLRRAPLAISASLGLGYVATVPFTTDRDPLSVFRFLFGTYANGVATAPYATNGAFNLYTLLTAYHQSDATRIAGIPCRVLGVAIVAIAVLAISIVFARTLVADTEPRRRLARTLAATSLSLLALFLFATRVHERYLLPALALGAPLAVEDAPTAIALAWLAVAFTINCLYSFKGLSAPGHPAPLLTLARAISLANIAAFAVLCHRYRVRTDSAPKRT